MMRPEPCDSHQDGNIIWLEIRHETVINFKIFTMNNVKQIFTYKIFLYLITLAKVFNLQYIAIAFSRHL